MLRQLPLHLPSGLRVPLMDRRSFITGMAATILILEVRGLEEPPPLCHE